jgi:hypothetical protein
MTDVAIISEMIKPAATIVPVTMNDRRHVTLLEPASPNSNVTISGLPNNAVVIKSDAWPSPNTVFKGDKGECKRADYAIVAEVGETTVLIYVEMKLGNGNTCEDIAKQLAGAKCFLNYCKAIGEHFWNEPNFLAHAQHRFVCFKQTSSIRKKTNTRNESR